MDLTMSERIRVILIKEKKTIADLAAAIGQSRQNLSNKLSRDNFTIEELKAIATALDYSFEATFVASDGTKI